MRKPPFQGTNWTLNGYFTTSLFCHRDHKGGDILTGKNHLLNAECRRSKICHGIWNRSMAPLSNEIIKQLGQGPEKLWRPMGHLTKYLQSQCFGLSLPSASHCIYIYIYTYYGGFLSHGGTPNGWNLFQNPNLKWMTGGTNTDPVARCYGSIPTKHGNLPRKTHQG